MKRLRKNRGITLIALIVTIVVLLILAGVTIYLVFGPNGIINKAQQADENTKISQVVEKMELAKGAEYIEGSGKYNPDDYFQRLEDEGIINDKDKDVIDNGDGTYEVTTDDGFIFEIIVVPSKDNPEGIEIEYEGKVDGPRIKNLKISSKTTNSITVEVEISDLEGATYTYYYKKDGETNWIKAAESEENTYTFSGLEDNAIYNIKVKLEKDGKTTEKETSTITGELPEGAVQFSPVEWNNGQASTIITTTEAGYTLQYQIDGIEENNWITITSGTTIENLKYGQTVYGILFDGTNYTKYSSIDIEDNNEPIVNNFIVTASDEKSITVSASGLDNESGLYSYTFQKSTTSDTTGFDEGVTQVSSDETCTYTYTGLQEETTYYLRVIVTDIAKNTKISTVITQLTASANKAPSVPTVAFSSKTNNSLTVTAKSTDENGDNLNYTLYAGTTSGNLDKVSSVVSQTQNQTATITVSGLNSYEYYYWRVDVSDGKDTTKGTEQSQVRTYCYTTECTTGSTVANGTNCSSCGGTGNTTTNTTCTACGGVGRKTCGLTLKNATYYVGDETRDYCEQCGERDDLTAYGCKLVCPTHGAVIDEIHYFCSGVCINAFYDDYGYTCKTYGSCGTCGGDGQVSTSKQCTTCGGDGKVTKYNYCDHGYANSHYWCAHGNDMGVTQHD